MFIESNPSPRKPESFWKIISLSNRKSEITIARANFNAITALIITE
jgi:hypothetical protein